MYLNRIGGKFLLILVSVFISLLFLEIMCRTFINLELDYYAQPKISKNKKTNIHPYGTIPINSEGFFDKEFNFNNRKDKIGYFGDSVTYGVGVGYPYRFTEYLDQISPNFDHLNLSGGLGLNLLNWDQKIEKFLKKNNISRIVYVMNLNDIAPMAANFIFNQNIDNDKKINKLSFAKYLKDPLDRLFRGRSKLYSFLRFKIKNYYTKKGFDASGYEAVELLPEKNKEKIIYAAKIINKWSENLEDNGFKACVVIVPYEMQISQDAKIYYKSIGIKFDKGFENFLTQNILKENLSKNIRALIIKDSFLEKKIGSYFIFDKGDKIDFNHPNKDGHYLIAKEIAKNKICQN